CAKASILGLAHPLDSW
nr:immunoglobulin heavy chain junction region [Macaca mulatta]